MTHTQTNNHTQQSQQLYARAEQVIPGGVNSPVRAYKSVGGNPLFFQRGEGCYLYDADNNRYVDLVSSWGAIILGHANATVVDAVQTATLNGFSFGASTALEVAMAEKICALVPSVEMVRMVNSGTEATMTAIRLARGYTGRDKIIKFEGCYHGHSDSLLVKAGSGALTFGTPSSAGVPEDIAKHTLVASFNNLDEVTQLFAENAGQIAGIIVEPIAGNMNFVLPQPGFLEGLRRLCDAEGSVLIFDEVMTGFRVALGGAQQLYGISPDLTTFSKVIGGGFPIGAFGGKRDIMQQLAPLGPVYQAGTLSGNPIAMSAGLATLAELSKPGLYTELTALSQRLVDGLCERAQAANLPFIAGFKGGMCGFMFNERQHIANYDDVAAMDVELFNRFFNKMLAEGVSLPPSGYEAFFINTAFTQQTIDFILQAAEKVFASL